MDKHGERRRHFKTPPVDTRQTQEARRSRALEEQKRKRSQQIDSSRQLDQFSGLSLDDSDDEVEDTEDAYDRPVQPMTGVAQFATMLHPNDAEPPPDSRSPSPFMGEESAPEQQKGKRKKRKGRAKGKSSKWANKCMYAELLEMHEDTLWTESLGIGHAPIHGGLPDDLETAWVGLAPVPVGKRCLAVTMQNAGLSGIVPNTVLRSRLLGKVILRPFPSPLPANTILDCILDENWRSNGILHVLDVVRWKGQDVAECEARFRFWWRDTRLAEVPVWSPPAPHKPSFANASSQVSGRQYVFPYPTTLVPVPYITPLPLEVILNDLLVKARHGRVVSLNLPVLPDKSTSVVEMEIDSFPEQSLSGGLGAINGMKEAEITIPSDGLLLYVGEASYESGESPLSVWVPRNGDEERVGGGESGVELFERLVRRRLVTQNINM